MKIKDLLEKEVKSFSDETSGFKKYPRARFTFTKERAEEFSRVTVKELVENPYFLNMKWQGNQGLYPAVLDVLIQLEEERKNRLINTFVYTGAVGGGKTTLATIITYIEIFKLIVIPDLCSYYNMAPNSTFAFVILSRDKDKAKRVTFKKFLPMFAKSPFFVDYYPTHIDVEKVVDNPRAMPSELRFPKDILLFPGGGSAAAALGHNCFTGDTKIKLADSSIKSFFELEGESNLKIKGFDTNNHQFVDTTAKKAIKTQENVDIYEIELEDGYRFKCTKNQKILTYKKDRCIESIKKRLSYKFEYKTIEQITEKDEIVTEKDFIKCKICGKLLTQITPSHCKLHNIKFNDYIKDLNKTEYVSFNIRNRIGTIFKRDFPFGHCLGRKHTEEEKIKIGLGNKGKIVSEETRLKQSIARKNAFISNPNIYKKGTDALHKYMQEHGNYWTGKKLPKEMIEKSRLARKGKKNKLLSIRLKENKAWVGKNNPMYGKDPIKPTKYYYNNIYFRGSWDMGLAKFLDENNIKWIYEPQRFEIKEGYTYLPDFFLPESNLYIEVKGYFRNKISRMKFELFSKKHPIILVQKKEMTEKSLILEAINENKIYKSSW